MIKIDFELSERAKEVTVTESITRDGFYSCKSKDSKNEWEVIKNNTGIFCNCPAFAKSKVICKHVVAVMNYEKIEYEIEKKEEDKLDPKMKFNLDRYEVISAFHKELRRGDVEKAWYWLEVMIQSNFGVWYINNYLLNIIGEEICCCDPQFIVGLKAYFNPSNKNYDDYLLYAGVDIFCNSKKFWECERCWQRKVYEARYKKNIQEGKKPLYEIPFYALDKHTLRGKQISDEKKDKRFSGTWESMYFRRKCIEQGFDLNSIKWNQVKLDEEELKFFRELDK